MILTQSDLHQYQETAVKHILEHKFCGIFLDMGLGKTVSALTAFNELKYNYLEITTALVIAPKRVASTVWAEECQKWEHLKHLKCSKIIGDQTSRITAIHTKADIYIISRDNVCWLCAYFNGVLPYDMIIVDELSSFKSYKAQRFKALKLTRPVFKRLVGLTGTPAPNGLIDLWPQIWLMDMGERLGKTISSYRQKYFSPGLTNGHIVFNYDLCKGSEELINEKIADICISMKAEDYLDMPPITYNNIELNMPDTIKKQYNIFEKTNILQLFSDEEDINAINAAALSNKLLQFANGAVYDDEHTFHTIHDIKLEALKEIIDDANGKSILVAWTFRSDRDRIIKYLEKYKPVELKGDKEIQDWNAGKIQILLAHPASAGHGLNLQFGGNIIIWFGLTYSLELYQQFNGRIYRQGQTNGVIINHLIMNDTHDKDVIKVLRSKDKVQASLLDSIKARINKYIK
jgi:SNF2 family DNA or RNA helicase